MQRADEQARFLRELLAGMVRSVNASWFLYRVRRLRLVVGRVVVLGILESVMCSVSIAIAGTARCVVRRKPEQGGGTGGHMLHHRCPLI